LSNVRNSYNTYSRLVIVDALAYLLTYLLHSGQFRDKSLEVIKERLF